MARYVTAQLNGGAYAGRPVLAPSDIELMHTGAAAVGGLSSWTGSGEGYGMGWFRSRGPNGIEATWHNGSTGDMHAIVLLDPANRWGVVLLYNTEALLHELTGKLDGIGWGVLSRLEGQPAPGNLRGLYAAFDALVVLVSALQLRSLVAAIRNRPARRLIRLPLPALTWRLPGRLWAVYRQLIMPLAILIELPRVVSAPWWPTLLRSDLGLWLFVAALLQLTSGALRLSRQPWLRARLAPLARRVWPRLTARLSLAEPAS
jgi:hypothetical protein